MGEGKRGYCSLGSCAGSLFTTLLILSTATMFVDVFAIDWFFHTLVPSKKKVRKERENIKERETAR